MMLLASSSGEVVQFNRLSYFTLAARSYALLLVGIA